jgi:uncharacterized protein involved in type VI secretion and phage assembly
MSDTWLDALLNPETGQHTSGFAIAPGIVTNNVDMIGEGRVQVKIPARPSFEPWCRLPSIGGSSGRGFMWVPQINDEVLVAFADNDTSSAYVLGGLWSTMNKPPLTLPNDTLSKRVIKTGLTEALGHKIELDDAQQSIKITTSTDQKITMDPTAIELTNLAGTLSIKLDNTQQTISITAPVKIELSAVEISLSAAATLDLSGATVSITASGPCTVQGLPIQLN